MKTFVAILIILFAIAVAFVVTKPTDQQCFDLMKSKVETSIANSNNSEFFKILVNVAISFGFNKAQSGFRFEDNIFYKRIYFGNIKIGSAYFGTFTVDNDFENAINQIRLKTQERENKIGHSLNTFFKHRAEPLEIGNDLATINQQLQDAYINLDKLKKFHFLRSNGVRAQQINQQEQFIQQLQQRKKQLEN